MEIDHVIWFVPALAEVEGQLEGFTIEGGRRHARQGTCNRRVMFERNYVEVLWIEDAAAVARHGLGFGRRCGGEAGACPFGVVLRGALGAEARRAYTRYELPDAPGLWLWLLTAGLADARLPFVAVFECGPDERAGKWPARMLAPEAYAHANGATSIERATFTVPTLAMGDARAALDELEVRDAGFVAGELPAVELALGSRRAGLTIDGGLRVEWSAGEGGAEEGVGNAMAATRPGRVVSG